MTLLPKIIFSISRIWQFVLFKSLTIKDSRKNWLHLVPEYGCLKCGNCLFEIYSYPLSELENVLHASPFILKLFVPIPILVILHSAHTRAPCIKSYQALTVKLLYTWNVAYCYKNKRNPKIPMSDNTSFDLSFFFYIVIKENSKKSLVMWNWCPEIFLLVGNKNKCWIIHFVATVCRKAVYSISWFKIMCCNAAEKVIFGFW